MAKYLLLISIISLSGCASQSVNDVRSEIVDVQRDIRQIKRYDTMPDISILHTIKIIMDNEDDS